MLVATIGVYRVLPLDFSYDEKEGRIPTFEITVHASELPDNPNELMLNDVMLTDGETTLSGVVAQVPRPEFTEDGTLNYTIGCDTDLGRLGLEMAADVSFKNVSISAAVATLLAYASNSTWILNDTSTLDDDVVTLDVRDRETLFAQLEMLLENAPSPTFMRFAGLSGSDYLLDIGTFDEQNLELRADATNILGDVRFKQSSNLPIKEMRPIGGKIGSRTVLLEDALYADPSLASDPDYPIVTDRIVNNTVIDGLRLRRRYTAHKTSNATDPTMAERSQAAISMYKHARKDMEDAGNQISVTMTVALSSMPLLYSQIYVKTWATEVRPDLVRQDIARSFRILIDEWLRITRIKFSTIRQRGTGFHDARPVIVVDLELTSRADRDFYDANKLLLNRMATNDLEDYAGTTTGEIDRVTVSVRHFNNAQDCTNGKLFYFPTPPIPPTAVAVSGQIIPPAGVTYAITQPLTLAQNLIICSSGAGGSPWTIADDVTINVVYTFT